MKTHSTPRQNEDTDALESFLSSARIIALAEFDSGSLNFGTANLRHPFSTASIHLGTIKGR